MRSPGINSQPTIMRKQQATNLLNLSADDVKKWIETFDTVLTDCDGVLWIVNKPIEGSIQTINKLKELKKKIFLITNDSRKTRSDVLQKALQLGLEVTENEIICSAHSTASYLKSRNFEKTVYVVGGSGITRELDALDIKHSEIGPDVLSSALEKYITTEMKLDTDIGAVVVGFDEHISYPKLLKAASYLEDSECIFLATNPDARFPMPGYVIPEAGCLVRAIETCAERKATITGKPNPNICEHLMREGVIVPERTLIIGDSCNTDILLGTNCGFQTMLVGTKIHQMHHVREWQENGNQEEKKLIPDVYLPKLGDLLNFL